MKKRGRTKKKGNVIFFPEIEKRLTDKGIESLQKKNFVEAVSLLEEAREHSPEDEEILSGLVLAYFESSAFQKAKELASEMLLKGIGDYFQMVDLYLTILIQLHEYQEIVTTIEALLEEKAIPPEKHEHFLTLLQFSQRMAEHLPMEEKEFQAEEKMAQKLNLVSLTTINEQMVAISSLVEKNIRPYIQEIEDYLMMESGHPFLKTMLLTLLKEQEYDKEISIRKFTFEKKIIPTELPEIRFHPEMTEIKNLLEDRLENNNPVLFENIIGMVERIFFITYPFNIEPDDTKAWAAAFHLLGHMYLGMEPKLSEVSADYQVSSKKIETAMTRIRKIEEISYPNL